MRRRAVLLSAAAIGLAGCAPIVGEFERGVRETRGVVSLDTSSNPWKVEVDTSLTAAELKQLGHDLHQLVMKNLKSLLVVHGVVEAPVSTSHPDPGLSFGPVPHLGWLRWLEGRPDLVKAQVTQDTAVVELASPDRAVAWALSFLDEVNVDDPGAKLEVRTDSVTLELEPGVDRAKQNFRRLAGAVEAAPLTLTGLSVWGKTSKTTGEVANGADAVAVVRALDGLGLPDPFEATVRLEGPGGVVWGGPLPQLVDLLVTGDETVRALAVAGARAKKLSDGSLEVVAPNAGVARAVVDLMAKPTWKTGDDVVVNLGITYFSKLTVGWWRKLGPLWADVVSSGFTRTMMSEPYVTRTPRGGRRNAFTLTVVEDREGPDLASPSGNQRIIDAMRRNPFEGEVRVRLGVDGEHLVFWSTSTGRAQEAHRAAQEGVREPQGWQLDFLRRWDASATE